MPLPAATRNSIDYQEINTFMQMMTPSGLYPPTNPSPAELHTGQLQDYELMLSAMREPQATVNLNNLILIGPFSPLHRVSEDGLNALWHVLRDRDYIDMCSRLHIRHGALSVTLEGQTYVYQGYKDSGERITLDLTQNARWHALTPRIERAAALLGGQINANRRITLGRMCWFYGLLPWQPRHPQEHPGAIRALQEKIASHQLRLEDDFEVLALRRRPTDADRATFRARRRSSADPLQVDTEKVHAQIIRAEIIDTVDQFLADRGASSLSFLTDAILAEATLEQVRGCPAVYLQNILHSAEAENLGTLLLSALDWYGGEIGEETSPGIRTWLIAQALQIWLAGPADDPQRISGYDWQAREHWGKSYQVIRAEFESHLLTSQRASSAKEAIVIARLFLSRFPSEFRVTGIPADLAYRSSLVWVNFLTGVNLIKASDARSLDRMTFQQLVNLPSILCEEATKEILTLISLARLQPTLDWAQTYGVIAHLPHEPYAATDIEQALTAFEQYSDDLTKASVQIDKKVPERLAISKREMETLFGKNSFNTDGRQLAKKLHPPLFVSRDIPYLEGKGYDIYSFLDVLAAGKFDQQEEWFVTDIDGSTVSQQWIQIDEHRTIETNGPLPAPGGSFAGTRRVWPPKAKLVLPDVKALFDVEFMRYLTDTTDAYATLIKSLLASLPYNDRLALEFGEVKIYSLRKETKGIEAQHETAEMILPLRARNGLILQATLDEHVTHYELLPRAGVMRRIEKLDPALFGGQLETERWSLRNASSVRVDVMRHKDLPFDWEAHSTGSAPNDAARCQAILEQLGDTLDAVVYAKDPSAPAAQTLSSERTVSISRVIATQLLFIDPKTLRDAANGITQFDLDTEWYKNVVALTKAFVPFWSSIEDLISGDRMRLINGSFGLFTDAISFFIPVGKFASGSLRLMTQTGRSTLRAALPSFKQLTMELVVSILGALNPLDGPLALLTGLGTATVKLARAGRFKVLELMGRAGRYDFVNSRPQIRDAGHWNPLVNGDELARVKGIDDVPVRNLANAGKSDYRLIDPLSSRLFGPTLATKAGELSPGRSHYRLLEKTDSHLIVELSKKSQVREVFEVDGRTTVFIDDVAYRLENDTLRRADSFTIEQTYKKLPCRVRRAGDPATCQTQYVNSLTPAPTPKQGVFDETNSWAPWFGDSHYTPAPNRAPLSISALAAHSTLKGTMEFQTGIYGRVKISVPVPEGDFLHTFNSGATIVEAKDGSRHYVFTRLDAGDFYVAERLKGQSVQQLLTFRKATTLAEGLLEELRVVYTGSLQANNMARFYGIEAVERAMKTMEDIAIPIGGHTYPPDTLKWLTVDTSPGEAVLFDHSTRMIVATQPKGATSWSRSTNASEAFRQRTAEIFDALFMEKVITQTPNSALKIDKTMRTLHSMLPRGKRSRNPRNIAYAEVTTASGTREVYVSVSGAQGITGQLPLFKQNFGADQVTVGETTYFNIDMNQSFSSTSLDVTAEGKLLAVPRTIDDIGTYRPELTSRPTSLDSESKLISVIRAKYPDSESIQSVNVATTMAPCDSCSVVMKQFAYDGGENALEVLWK